VQATTAQAYHLESVRLHRNQIFILLWLMVALSLADSIALRAIIVLMQHLGNLDFIEIWLGTISIVCQQFYI
jgi:hypothetical protein